MIAPVILVHQGLCVWIQGMDLIAFVHHGKPIVPIVRTKIFLVFSSNRITYHLKIFFIQASNVGCSCRNGGRCLLSVGSYICECPYGYNGMNCETSKPIDLHLTIFVHWFKENFSRRHLYSESLHERRYLSNSGTSQLYLSMPTGISRTNLSNLYVVI